MLRYDRDGLLRHSLIVMVFIHLGSVMNLVFHMVMGRVLSKEEYGILASMLGVVLIVATPMMALQSTLAHFSARFVQEDRKGSVRCLIGYWYKRLVPISLLVLVVAYAFRSYFQMYFQLPTTGPILATGSVVALVLLMPVIPGIFQGLQRFFWMCVSVNTWGGVRLILGTILVFTVGRYATCGLAAQAVGVACSFAIGVAGLLYVLRDEPAGDREISGIGQYFVKAFITLASFGFLMNADVVMVKHYFAPERAGLFARSATIARTVIFLCQPIAMALFPKVVSKGEAEAGHRMTLLRAVGIAAALIGAAVLVCLALPQLPMRVIFGEAQSTAEQLFLVRIVTLSMSPLAMTLLLVNFQVAQHRFALLGPLMLCAIGYAAGVAIWHESLMQVVTILASVSLASAVLLVVGLPWKRQPTEVSATRL